MMMKLPVPSGAHTARNIGASMKDGHRQRSGKKTTGVASRVVVALVSALLASCYLMIRFFPPIVR